MTAQPKKITLSQNEYIVFSPIYENGEAQKLLFKNKVQHVRDPLPSELVKKRLPKLQFVEFIKYLQPLKTNIELQDHHHSYLDSAIKKYMDNHNISLSEDKIKVIKEKWFNKIVDMISKIILVIYRRIEVEKLRNDTKQLMLLKKTTQTQIDHVNTLFFMLYKLTGYYNEELFHKYVTIHTALPSLDEISGLRLYENIACSLPRVVFKPDSVGKSKAQYENEIKKCTEQLTNRKKKIESCFNQHLAAKHQMQKVDFTKDNMEIIAKRSKELTMKDIIIATMSFQELEVLKGIM